MSMCHIIIKIKLFLFNTHNLMFWYMFPPKYISLALYFVNKVHFMWYIWKCTCFKMWRNSSYICFRNWSWWRRSVGWFPIPWNKCERFYPPFQKDTGDFSTLAILSTLTKCHGILCPLEILSYILENKPDLVTR